MLQHHYDQLHTGSGLCDQIITERGYQSILVARRLQEFGFGRNQLRTPGLLLPIWVPNGTDTGSNTSLNGEYVRLTNKTKGTIDLRSWREVYSDRLAGEIFGAGIMPAKEASQSAWDNS